MQKRCRGATRLPEANSCMTLYTQGYFEKPTALSPSRMQQRILRKFFPIPGHSMLAPTLTRNLFTFPGPSYRYKRF